MTIENLPVTVDFFDKNFGNEPIPGFPKLNIQNPAEILDFKETAKDLVAKHFKKGCETIYPLLKEKNIGSILICIDLKGSILTTPAAYESRYFSSRTGDYWFLMRWDLLRAYFHELQKKDYVMDPDFRFIWEHEMVHLLDHKNIVLFQSLMDGLDVRKSLVNHLLLYRNEGIANLLITLKGHGKSKSLNTARLRFRMTFFKLQDQPWEEPGNFREFENSLSDSESFYDIGPWMILHVLTCPKYKRGYPDAARLIQLLEEGKSVDDADIIMVIRKGLLIDNHSFMDFIAEPGWNGKPFIEPSVLLKLVERVRVIKPPRHEKLTYQQYVRSNQAVTRLFLSFWPDLKDFRQG